MENNQNGFDFSVFFHNFRVAFRRLFWLPLVLALLLGSFGYWRRLRDYRPIYEAKAVYLVSSNYITTTDITAYGAIYDSNAASKLTSSFRYILQTDAARQMIYQRTGSYSLPATVTGTSMADSNIFTISAQASTPESARQAVEVVAEVFPQAAANILGNITLEPLEKGNPYLASDDPIYPFSPNSTVIKYALFGLAVGLALIGIAAWLRKTVHSESDLKQLVSIPCLGTLPAVRFKARTGANRSVLLTNPKVSESYLESVNAMRFNLKKELDRQSAQVIMVTSTSPGEGKTTLAANLALSLSAQGSRVLLLDADLRKPEQKKLFGITEPSQGLPELIAAKSDAFTPLTVPDSNLLLVSGDKAADQPLRFLDSPQLRRLLKKMREQADYVVIDTPPSGLLSDAASLAQSVDGVIYVVRQDYTNRVTIADSMQLLAATDVRFLGCVLNNTERSTTKYGYGYRGYYGSKYGGYYGYYGSKYYGKKSKQSDDEAYTK